MYSQIHISGATRQQLIYDNAVNLLRMVEPPEGYYLATSFGKDSIVAHRLLDEAGVKYDAHNNHTTVDPPELVQFGRKHYPDVERIYPRRSMWQLIEQHNMPPLRMARYCCNELKEQSGRGRVLVFGIRAAESARRAAGWSPVTRHSPNKANRIRLFDNDDIVQAVQSCQASGGWVVNPLFSWTDEDVWDFICDRKLPYCELYDQGFKRLGCIGCPMATLDGRLLGFERWPTYKTAYIHAFDRMITNEKTKTWKDGEDCFRWWISPVRTGQLKINGQISINDMEAEA